MLLISLGSNFFHFPKSPEMKMSHFTYWFSYLSVWRETTLWGNNKRFPLGLLKMK